MANNGALWQEVVQMGKETTVGTGVAATRKAYLSNVAFTKNRANTSHKFATGTRDNVRAVTQGVTEAGGSVELLVSGDELLEWLAVTFGPAVITTPATGVLTRLHTYKPGVTLDSMTLERNDGQKVHRLLGVRGNGMEITGSVDGDNTAKFDLFATDRDDTFATLTGSLTDRNPTFLQGWQSNIYIDNLGATPGTTNFTDLLTDWSVKFGGNLGRVYAAGNTQAAIATIPGEIDISADLTFLAASAQAATSITNWGAGTPRLLRLEFIDSVLIETTLKRFVTVDIPGYWDSPDFNKESQGVRAYGFPLNYVYDATLGAGIVVRCQAARTLPYV